MASKRGGRAVSRRPSKRQSKPAAPPRPPRREKLGLAEVDEQLRGGIAKGSRFLLFGLPGVGKTALGLSFLLEGIEHGQGAHYVSVDGGARSLPWPPGLSSVIDREHLKIHELGAAELSAKRAQALLSQFPFSGSQRAFVELGGGPGGPKPGAVAFMKVLLEGLRRQGVTTMVGVVQGKASRELEAEVFELCPDPDGVFYLRLRLSGASPRRELVILSLRGEPLEKSVYELRQQPRALKQAAAEPAAAGKGAGTMLITAPWLVDDSEKVQYVKRMRNLLKRPFGETQTQKVFGRLLFKDILSSLYSSETDYGILLVHHPIIPHLASENLLQPLEEVFPDFPEQFLDTGIRKGLVGKRLYSIPQHVSMRLLFYRKDLLDRYGLKPPRTWDELEAQGRHILEREKDPKLCGLFFENRPELYFGFFMEHLWSQNEEVYEDERSSAFNHKGVIEALGRIHHLVSRSEIYPRHDPPSTTNQCADRFLAGEAVFFVHWSDMMKMIHRQGSGARERFGWALMPTARPGLRSQALVGGPSYVIPKRTRFPHTAVELLKRLVEGKFAVQLHSDFGWPFPGMRELYQDRATMERHPYYSEADLLLSHGRLIEEVPAFRTKNFISLRNAAIQEIQASFQPQVGDLDLAAASRALEKRLAGFLTPPQYSPLVSRAVEAVQKNLFNPLSVGALAHEFDLTPTYFIGLFRRETGRTPANFIKEMKVAKAKELLSYSNMNVNEVADRMGFKTVQHFCRVFKQVAKRSPKFYKRARQGDGEAA